MDLSDGRSRQLTDLPDIFAGGAWYIEATRSLYFWAGSTICRTKIDTLETDELYREPVQGSYISASADGRYVAYAMPIAPPDDPKEAARTDRPQSAMTMFDTQTGQRRVLCNYPFQVSHICFSPVDLSWMTFCWEGSWHRVPQRVWWVDVTGKLGGPLGPQPPNQARGHEFFFQDGNWVGFHGSQCEPDGKEIGWFFGRMTTDGKDVELFWTPGPTGHCQAHQNPDGTLKVICDVGGERGERTDGWIALIHCDSEQGKGQFERLHSHGASWVTQGAHPHPQFRPGGNEAVFTTDRKGPKAGTDPNGFSNVYLIET
jgi:hypothetical protein